MIYGDNKPYNVALVVADMPTLEKWAEENGIGARGEALFDEERVRKLFEEEIEKYSAEFKQFEKIRKFLLIAEDFTTANDMLTPSLKVKRRFVMKKYGERLDALFS
jgi:long-chain acyl-CoA synthetase